MVNKWGFMEEEDYAEAKRNRKRIANKENIEGYLIAEKALASTPVSKKLPKNVPIGSLPYGKGKYYREET